MSSPQKFQPKSQKIEKARGFWYYFGICAAVAVVSGVFGYYLNKIESDAFGAGTVLHEDSSDYKFINPTLLSLRNENIESKDYASLKNTLTQYITSTISTQKAQDVSVYFRDMNSGNWTGVNYDDTYAPGSMLKVAVLMAYLHQAELDPSMANDSTTVSTQGVNLDAYQYFPPTHPIELGKTYTNDQLVTAMITDSDNNAASLLEQIVGDDKLNDIYKELEMPIQNQGGTDYLSPKLYSRLFRTIYNGSFLSDQQSEKALQLMSQSNFNVGLVAGVPSGTIVAHKFGEQSVANPIADQSNLELHDCGIIYYTDHPYFLCVMTKGSDYPTLEGVISTISKTTWSYVKNEYH